MGPTPAKRSKVCPTSASSREHNPVDPFNGKITTPQAIEGLDETFEPETTNEKGRGQLKARLERLNEQVRWNCRLLSHDFAEVCFVSGIISTTIGSLVAMAGIFTRNQARTRLYMEGFGCGMVILGVFVVFTSLRIRARRHLEMMQLNRMLRRPSGQHGPEWHRRHHQQHQQHLQHIHHQPARRRHFRDEGANPFVATPTPTLVRDAKLLSGDQATSLLWPDTRSPATVSSLPGWPISDNNREAKGESVTLVCRNRARPPWRSTSLINLSSSREEAAEQNQESLVDSLLASGGGAGDSSSSLSFASTGSQWAPCLDTLDSAYCNHSHEAATIEAALSIVLTTSTVAGFRPDQAEISERHGDKHERFCCLHHTVQQMLRARKWINSLKMHGQSQSKEHLEASCGC